jgi:hypothetical protein
MDPVFRKLTQVHNLKPYLFKIHFNIIIQFKPKYPNGLFVSGFSTKSLYVFFTPHVCYMFRPPNPPLIDHSSNILWTVQIMTLLTV